jgi:hypothetical protein
MKHLLSYKLFEDRAQLEIPFGGKDPLHDKPDHVHIKDALESMHSMDPRQFKSSDKLERAWQEAYPKALEIFKRNPAEEGSNDVILDFVKDHYREDIWNKHIPQWVANYVENNHQQDLKKFGVDYMAYVRAMEKFGVEESLNPKGQQLLDARYKEVFDHNLEKNGIYRAISNSYKKNGGLIDVWRAINYRKGDSAKDLFEEITGRYKGVGFFWSWKRQGAVVYWMAERGGTQVIMHGKVRIDDVDWMSTIYKGSYFLNNEDEIALHEETGMVLINSFELEGKTVSLDYPVVVSTGKHSYHGGFNKEAA